MCAILLRSLCGRISRCKDSPRSPIPIPCSGTSRWSPAPIGCDASGHQRRRRRSIAVNRGNCHPGSRTAGAGANARDFRRRDCARPLSSKAEVIEDEPGRSDGKKEVGFSYPRVRAVAATGQEPHAADRAAACSGHSAAVGTARPAGRDRCAGDRPVLRRDERGGRCDLRQPAAAVRDRGGDRLRQEGGRFHGAGRGRRVPGDRGGLQVDVTDRPGGRPGRRRRTGPDQLQRVRRHPGRPSDRGAVRPLSHHSTAVVSRFLRWSTLRADRGVGGVPVHGLRAELLLPDLQRRTDLGWSIHRWLRRFRRVHLRFRQSDAHPDRPAPHPEHLCLVPLRHLSDTRRLRGHRGTHQIRRRATRPQAC